MSTDNKRVAVVLVQAYGNNLSGEVCGFDAATAERLKAKGIAKDVPPQAQQNQPPKK